jgi:hypothetical protein
MQGPSEHVRARAQPGRLSRWWSRRARLVVALALVTLWVHPAPPGDAECSRDCALRRELRERFALVVDDRDSIHWAETEQTALGSRFARCRAAVVARAEPKGARDVYLVFAALSPEGRLLRVADAYNLTQTRTADERQLVGHGQQLAWALGDSARTYRVELADLGGERASLDASWSLAARVKRQGTNLQQTGQRQGVLRRSFKLEPAASKVALQLNVSGLSIRADERLTRIPADPTARAEGLHHIVEHQKLPALPGNWTTWAVDRVRSVSWFGSDRMQLLKAVTYRALDVLENSLPSALSDADADDDADDEENDPAVSVGADAEIVGGAEDYHAWPPAPLPPVVTPALDGEGRWRSLASDPYVKHTPGLPPPFTSTFIRPDPRRHSARVVIVMWDPRRVDLHFAAGTEEPASDTGEVGSGLVSRRPGVIENLVGAFNGGFQTTHGQWGTLEEGRLLVAPRPFGATVARLKNGSTALGTWPLSTEVPAAVDSFRQNLTALVAGGLLNPYARQWWGGVPRGWTDTTRTVRSALCSTSDGFMGYFYGSRVDHESLGRALLAARCDYGIHLDMNTGHTGFEIYSVVPRSTPPLPRHQLATRWKTQGVVPDMPQLAFRARRLFRNMQLMHFPRYIRRQTRDFFYLTERETLPGAVLPAPLSSETEPEGRWTTVSRLGEGTPPPIAISSLRPDAARPQTKVRVVQLDLKWLGVQRGALGASPDSTLMSITAPTPAPGDVRVLWVDENGARVGGPAGSAVAVAVESDADQANCAWGIRQDRILVHAAVVTTPSPGPDAALLKDLLVGMGCTTTLLAQAPSVVMLAEGRDPSGHPVTLGPTEGLTTALHFHSAAWDAFQPLFPNAPIVPPEVWRSRQPQ